METQLFLFWVLFLTFVQTSESTDSSSVDQVKFEARPEHLSLGLGGTLSLRCEIPPRDTTGWKNYDAILISRVGTDEFPQIVGTISSLDKYRVLSGGGVDTKISGHLDKTEGGYVKVNFEYNSLRDAGSYFCFVKGRDASSFEGTLRKKIKITAEKPTLEKLFRYVFLLKDQLKDSKKDTSNLRKYIDEKLKDNKNTASMSNLKQNLDLNRANIRKNNDLIVYGNFVESAPFNGHVYRLSLTQHQNVEQSQKVCETMGGYLAEPNDRAEFLFIQSFLKNLAFPTTNPWVYIGLTDEEDEGKWVFLKNKNDPIFLNFAPGQPNADETENYMVLWTSEYLYGDIPSAYKGHNDLRFLCEI